MYFTTHLRDQHTVPVSLRAVHCQRPAKAPSKRNPADSSARASSDSDSDLFHGQDEEAPSTPAPAPFPQAHPRTTGQSSTAVSPAPEKAQLRVAGLLPDRAHDVPPPPFPHAPASTLKKPHGSTRIQQQMASPPVHLYAVDPAPTHPLAHDPHDGLKRSHLDNLSTLMHSCLLKGDYDRASRAWGMILRTQVAGGTHVDPRNHGRWGVGAEILLRRNPQTPRPDSHDTPQPAHQTSLFSPEGFELARNYYERLIVQHPTRKTQPYAVDERIFYPPMFSLWIYEVREKSKRAKMQLQDELANRSVTSRSMSVDSAASGRPDDSGAKEEAIRTDELAQAIEIAERLDQVISSPPFDRQANLLQLRANVALWISDLALGTLDVDEDWDAEFPARISASSNMPVSNRIQRLSNARRELKEAHACFEQAAANGAKVQAPLLSSINLRLTQVTKYLDKLQPSQFDDDDY
ncbi:hypothetical protein COCVIDRAFT_18253 [Bipolaris victoriae FI3]|uniref:Uncharacterized protein n=1 Tax=Bipolaris victoriae (strain FI3) TaxID=930091 RepID=W7EES6_BIPV3|nr:hypothetical protein COCVIDRAFT_18253 [Bipolaris victoriae FI3]